MVGCLVGWLRLVIDPITHNLTNEHILSKQDHHPSNTAPFRPRIVNVTSFAGLYYGQASMGAYSASKHAAEAFRYVRQSVCVLLGRG